jgi:hypothetical protein
MPLSQRDKLVDQLTEQCHKIETAEEPFAPLVFHAEGSVTNGSVLTKFRRGAFVPLKTVQPYFVEYEYYMVSPSYDCILGLELFVLCACSSPMASQIARLHIFPEFTPNEYLWKTHKQDFKEKWEIFAWAVHDFLSKRFDIPENPQQNREKVNYQEFVFGQKDSITVNGKTFKWPHEDNKKAN